jgi:hypothetical protein
MDTLTNFDNAFAGTAIEWTKSRDLAYQVSPWLLGSETTIADAVIGDAKFPRTRNPVVESM